jgi:hypothetical protein
MPFSWYSGESVRNGPALPISLSSANGACLHDLILGIVVTLTDLAIPRTNSINVTAIAKDDVTLTSAELTTTDDGPSLDDADSRVI